MQTIDIFGANYAGRTDHTRTACRAVIVEGGRILLMHAEKVDVWMLPGGGLEQGESLEACCIREAAEEAGVTVQPFRHAALLREFYEDWRYDSHFFLCRIVGQTQISLTQEEIETGVVPKWLPFTEALALFVSHEQMHPVTDLDEQRRGICQREYTALNACLSAIENDLPDDELRLYTPGDLTDMGICPTCLNRKRGGALYGDMTDKLVYADDDIECFFVGNPRAPGHMCIASVDHYHDMSEAPDAVNEKIIRFSSRLMRILCRVYGCERVYLCTMCDGPMNHYHVQLIPRYPHEKRGSRNFVKQRSTYAFDEAKFIAVKTYLAAAVQCETMNGGNDHD